MHILKHLKCPVRLKYSSSYLAINKWWCCEMFPDHSGGPGGARVDGRSQGLDWVDRPSFRLGSTATCHSSSAPARNHPISSARSQKVTGMVVHTLSKQRESLLLRAPSPGTLVPLNHFPNSGHAGPLGWDSGHYAVFAASIVENNLVWTLIWFYP